jgi:type IV secretory pathway VirB10-like protein
MLRFVKEKLFASKKMRTKSRKHSRGGKTGRTRISIDRGSTFSDELSELEYVPHDIDVAKWVLGVQNPIQKSGYNPLSRRRSSSSYYFRSSPMPPPPTPVRSSSRLPLTRIHNHNYPLQQYQFQQRFQSALNQNNNVRNQLNKYNSNKKSRPKSKDKLNKTKSKTLKSVANKQSHRQQKYDKSGSKSKRSYSKDRSMSKRRQVSLSAALFTSLFSIIILITSYLL